MVRGALPLVDWIYSDNPQSRRMGLYSVMRITEGAPLDPFQRLFKWVVSFGVVDMGWLRVFGGASQAF